MIASESNGPPGKLTPVSHECELSAQDEASGARRFSGANKPGDTDPFHVRHQVSTRQDRSQYYGDEGNEVCMRVLYVAHCAETPS